MATRWTLIVEGDAALRKGLEKLLEQRLRGQMPKIVMGEGKSQAVAKFKAPRYASHAALLVDLDKPGDMRAQDLRANALEARAGQVYFMIHEMESWFLSQPDVLSRFYGKIPNWPKRPAPDIPDPVKVLEDFSRGSSKGTYHKTKHASPILSLLDVELLAETFEDVANLFRLLGEPPR